MSRYPTTDDVRQWYSELPWLPQEKTWYPHRAKEFDNWLASHNAEVVKATEERIIDLLIQNFHRFDLSNNGNDYPMGLPEFVALIKGETK